MEPRHIQPPVALQGRRKQVAHRSRERRTEVPVCVSEHRQHGLAVSRNQFNALGDERRDGVQRDDPVEVDDAGDVAL
jgi:hypothetical protein